MCSKPCLQSLTVETSLRPSKHKFMHTFGVYILQRGFKIAHHIPTDLFLVTSTENTASLVPQQTMCIRLPIATSSVCTNPCKLATTRRIRCQLIKLILYRSTVQGLMDWRRGASTFSSNCTSYRWVQIDLFEVTRKEYDICEWNEIPSPR